MECYFALNRQFTVAEYLTTVTNELLRQTSTRDGLSGHNLALDTGRHRQTWLHREDRLCSRCTEKPMGTEIPFFFCCTVTNMQK